MVESPLREGVIVTDSGGQAISGVISYMQTPYRLSQGNYMYNTIKKILSPGKRGLNDLFMSTRLFFNILEYQPDIFL